MKSFVNWVGFYFLRKYAESHIFIKEIFKFMHGWSWKYALPCINKPIIFSSKSNMKIYINKRLKKLSLSVEMSEVQWQSYKRIIKVTLHTYVYLISLMLKRNL